MKQLRDNYFLVNNYDGFLILNDKKKSVNGNCLEVFAVFNHVGSGEILVIFQKTFLDQNI